MKDNNHTNQKIQMLLLQESIWLLEDKIDRILDELSGHQLAIKSIESIVEAIVDELGNQQEDSEPERVRQ